MLDQLKSLYGRAFISHANDNQEPDHFYWFQTEMGIPFGLRKSAVTDHEYQLLTLMFQAVDLPPKLLSKEERQWSSLLFEGHGQTIELSNEAPRYLLHIYFKIPFKEMDSFREAVLALFDESPIILWRNNHTALLILKTRPNFGKTEEIAQLLAEDFYSDVKLFTGQALNDPNLAKPAFDLEESAFALARNSFPEKRSYAFEKVIPALLLSALPKDFLTPAFSSLLTAIKDEDPEWVTSLFAFFEHGMNITAASKSLFIHRNSLQYRLEKFAEKTGLDPKRFDDALFIYLALLTKKLN